MELEDYEWVIKYSGVVTVLLGFPFGSMAVHAGQGYPRWLMVYIVLLCLSLYKLGASVAALATGGRDDLWWAPLIGGGGSMTIFFTAVVTLSGGGGFTTVMTQWYFWYAAMAVGAVQLILGFIIGRLQAAQDE
jgi:hypothetical protein